MLKHSHSFLCFEYTHLIRLYLCIQYHASEHSSLSVCICLSGSEVWHPLCKQASRTERKLRVSVLLLVLGPDFKIPSDLVYSLFIVLYSSGAHQKPPSLLRAPALVHPAGSSV